MWIIADMAVTEYLVNDSSLEKDYRGLSDDIQSQPFGSFCSVVTLLAIKEKLYKIAGLWPMQQ